MGSTFSVAAFRLTNVVPIGFRNICSFTQPSHLVTYPVMNPVFPMPRGLAESGRASLEAQLDGPWRTERRILAGPVQTPPAWFLEALNRRGYRLRRMGELLEFQR